MLESITFFSLSDWDYANMLTASLNASEQRELASRMERKQLKEFMGVRFAILQLSVSRALELTPPDVLQTRPTLLR